MDRVKAIKVLKPLIDSYVDYANISMKEEDDDIVEALEMAVEALDVPDTNVGDMIDRQAALDIYDDYNVAVENGELEAYGKHRKRLLELPSAQPATSCSEIPNGSDDTISRQAAIDALDNLSVNNVPNADDYLFVLKGIVAASDCIETLPAAQPERDVPIKPIETTDTAWGIQNRQAVCPKCDYYLGHVAFLGDYKGKKVTYCETCGQAIDWEGW